MIDNKICDINKKNDIKKCAPGIKYEEGSCFTLDQLIRIAKNYNLKFNDKIKIVNNKRLLLKSLIRNISKNYNCESQNCWLNIDFIKQSGNDIKYNTLRPNGPKKSKKWLSTTDINKSLKQYENKFNDFKYLGTLPYDFEDIDYFDIRKYNFSKDFDKGIKKYGMVINLDTHDMNGSHWVSLYFNFDTKEIYFFDSFGKKPKKRILDFMKKITNKFDHKINKKYFKKYKDIDKFSKKLDKKYNIKFKFNKIQHQFKNTECGVYSMNFIIRLLNKESFNSITQNITRDDIMNSCRDTYFR